MLIPPPPPPQQQQQPVVSVDQSVKAMRIILLALTMGVVSFGGIAIFRIGGEPKGEPLLVWMGLAMGAGAFVVRQVLRVVMPTGIRRGITSTQNAEQSVDRSSNEPRLISGYQTLFIVSAALLEGACFFNLICYMVEHQWPSLALVGVALVINLSTFPSKDGVETWIQQQFELIDLERNQVN